MKKSNKTKTVFATVFLVISVGLIALSVYFFVDEIKFSQVADEVRGEVVSVETRRDSDGDRHTSVYVSYEYEGETYEYVKIKERISKSRYEGQRLTLYVDSENPSDARTTKAPVGGIALFCMGAFVMVVPITTFVHRSKKNNEKKVLLKKGTVIMVTVEHIVYDQSVTVNGRSPLMLQCSYFDMFTGQKYNFLSESVWDDLNYLFKPNDQIPVYVMPNDYSKYYVNLEPQNGKPRVVDFT